MASIGKNAASQSSLRSGVKLPMRASQNTRSKRVDSSNLAGTKRRHERYMGLVRQAMADGDRIEAENMLQHAEHYFRLMHEL